MNNQKIRENEQSDMQRNLSTPVTDRIQLREKKRRTGFILQIFTLIILGILVVGVITFITQYQLSSRAVREQIEELAGEHVVEVAECIKEYPAYEWLIRYWYEHSEEMDVEYDVDFSTGIRTQEKSSQLIEHQSQLQLKYVSAEELESLPAEDQKLYAEIIYSWLITRINHIKRSYGIDYLFVVITGDETTEHPFEDQWFLLSGADEGAVRGTDYLQVYPLGWKVSVSENESQQNAMRSAVRNAKLSAENGEEYEGYIAPAGDYIDYYSYLTSFDDRAVLIGLTYNLSGIMKNIRLNTWKGTGYSVLYQIILLLIVMLSMFVLMLHPLKTILKNIRLYTETKNTETVSNNLSNVMKGIGSYAIKRNEIGELSEEFDDLMHEIDDYTERIESFTSDREKIEAELELGAHIQTGILPNKFPAFPDRKEFDLYAVMDPAREVGGDLYDYFLPDEDHFAMTIADVSGKGVPAALFMMATKIVLNNQVSMRISPALALEMANNRICENNYENMFVTVWLATLEISTGKLFTSNAGHEYPAIKQPDGTFELFKDRHGFVVGGMEGVKYKEEVIQLKPGAKVFVYTDGVPEATNSDNEFFGTDRMLKALRDAEDGTPEEIINAVRKAVDDFTGDAEQFDDLTMLCMEYKGPEC